MNEIRHRVGIKASVDDVFKAIHKPDQIQLWWATVATGTGILESSIDLEFPGYPTHRWQIVELRETQIVRLRLLSGPDPWIGSELCFELHETDDQVFVTLIHTVGQDTTEAAIQYFQTKWPMFLVSLKQLLETGRGMPFPNDIKIQHG